MTLKVWNVVFFECRPRQGQCTGTAPVEKLIHSFTTKSQAQIAKKLNLLAAMGPSLRGPHVKHVRGKIWELRLRPEGTPLRILYFFSQKGQIILLHGFKKSSRKTPAREIEDAESRKTDFLNRQ